MVENEKVEEQAENAVERIPAPVESGESTAKKTWKIIGMVALAIVIFLLGVLTQWLLIEPEMRALIKVKDKIDAEYYDGVSNESFYDAIFDAVNNEVLDEYSCYMTADEYAAATSASDGNRSGIGLVFYTGTEDSPQMQIVRVCGNSPAEKAGFCVGDCIIGFGKDKTSLQESVLFSAFSKFLSALGADVPFFVKAQTKTGERLFTLQKSAYVENYVFYRTSGNAYSFTTGKNVTAVACGEPLSALPSDTAYIRLIQFEGNAAAAFDRAMAQFKADGKKNLVLDLRENGGGDMRVLQSVAKYFCKGATAKKPTVAIADYGESKKNFYADGNVYSTYFAADSRICVLADCYTASASECLLGCMLSYGATTYADICLTEIDGQAKTFGKGIMQTTYPLSLFEQDAVKLTTARICWPNGNCIHGRGILAADGTKTVARSYGGETELTTALERLF